MTERYNVDQAIRGCLVGALVEAGGNMSKVALLTGLPRATCYRYVKRYGINVKEIRHRARGFKLG